MNEENIHLYNADCFDVLPTFGDNSIDMVLISLAKSILRIAGCIMAIRGEGVSAMAWCFLAAEALGILEEVFDGR